ncbi:MAG: hypothetical protein EOO71_20130 [Myxococcaceae bacterium]|nr:MAG: hypothetical protein EOO71_20130 [Myxococcaceae bacterium]
MKTRPDTVALALVLFTGVSLVLWQVLAGRVPSAVQWTVFAALMLGGGIPHGALDHLIVAETDRREGRAPSWIRFLSSYLLILALYALAWRVVPVWSLGAFVLLSAWHFGEADLEGTPDTGRWLIARILTGGFALALLLLTHAAEVTPILERLTRQHEPALWLWRQAVSVAAPLLLGFGALVTGIARNGPARGDRNVWWLGWAGVLLLGCFLPLLLAFALYFGGWHAWRSFRAIHRYLGERHDAPPSLPRLWMKALPFTALALGALPLMAAAWRVTGQRADPLPLLFVFLAVITLPHLRVMHGLHRRLA